MMVHIHTIPILNNDDEWSNWQTRIDEVSKSLLKEFNNNDVERSSSFFTCVIGENKTALQKQGYTFNSAFPNESILQNLGYDFYDAICSNDVDHAQEIVNQIKMIAYPQTQK